MRKQEKSRILGSSPPDLELFAGLSAPQATENSRPPGFKTRCRFCTVAKPLRSEASSCIYAFRTFKTPLKGIVFVAPRVFSRLSRGSWASQSIASNLTPGKDSKTWPRELLDDEIEGLGGELREVCEVHLKPL